MTGNPTLFPLSDTRLKCISLWAPWAYWVAFRWKVIETRLHARFASLVGQRIGIHVAERWDSQAIELAGPYLTESRIQATERIDHFAGYQRVLCTALVARSRWLTDADSAAALIDCGGEARFGIFLEDIKPLPMRQRRIPGRQGPFYVELNDD